MADSQVFEQFFPSAYEWARAQETFILERGFPLDARSLADARGAGVKEPERVRVLVVDRIPMPENADLAQASRRAHIITEASCGIAVGYGVIIRADRWGDRELLVHQLVHVAQFERSGTLEAYLKQYLCDRRDSPDFTKGAMEDEACRVAREVCQKTAS